MTKGLSSDEKHWIGFDLGGTKMLATLYDSEFTQIGRKRQRTLGHQGSKAGLERIIETIEGAIESATIDKSQIGGIGIGCPGPVDMESGTIIEAPNLGWENVPICKALEDHFSVPAKIINDVDSGLYGEYRFGAARGAYCAIGIFPGTGIGGGCVLGGNIVRGSHVSCMEIGHVQVMADGPLCGCGQRGCLEAVASRLAISGAAAQAAYRGVAPGLMKATGTDLSNIRSGALADSVSAGDKAVEEIIVNAAQHIGTVVASVVNLLSPDIIVLGGGLVEAMPELIIDAVKKTANNRVMPAYRKSFKVKEAELGDNAAVKGAAAWAQQICTSEE